MALRPVAEDGEGLVGEYAEIGIFVSVYFGGHGGRRSEGESESEREVNLKAGSGLRTSGA
jgi:hypothetical protein